MKTRILVSTLASLLFATFLFTACQKDEDAAPALDSNTEKADLATNDDLTAGLFDEVFEEVESSEVNNLIAGFKSASTNDCPTRSIEQPSDNSKFPKTVTIDFGEGCEHGNRGVKKGKIKITVTGPVFEAGSKKIIAFEDFFINDIKVEGTKTITYNGLNDAGNPTLTVNLENGSVTKTDGVKIERSYTHTIEHISGSDTRRIHLDDVFEISGTANGVNYKGISYTVNITKPIVRQMLCRYPVAGTREITAGNDVIIIDYGNGDCDNMATIQINGGQVTEFEMQRGRKRR